MEFKKIVFLVLLYSFPAIAYMQNNKIVFVTEKQDKGIITLSHTKLKDNKFDIEISVDWVDDFMNRKRDDQSLLVLTCNKLKIFPKGKVTCSMLNKNKYLTFNSNQRLTFDVAESFNSDSIVIVFSFDYAENGTKIDVNYSPGKFVFQQPRNIEYKVYINRSEIEDRIAPSVIAKDIGSNETEILTNLQIYRLQLAITDNRKVKQVRVNEFQIVKLNDSIYYSDILMDRESLPVKIIAVDESNNQTVKELTISKSKNLIGRIDKGIYYAIIIGIDEYNDPQIPQLDNPTKDAEKLQKVLQAGYLFNDTNIILLKNPTRADIMITFDKISSILGENDNLLIFYAGHGYWDSNKQLGYWLPKDAAKSNTANWIHNSVIRDYIFSIHSKHTLLITDACFSGSIFKSRGAFFETPASVEKLYELPSRKAMTSGTLTEVPDASIFINFLLKRLENNQEKFLPAEKLYHSFREAILNNSKTVPQFGVIQGTGDEGGDFIFIKR